jgi:signal transduction histidine kinase
MARRIDVLKLAAAALALALALLATVQYRWLREIAEAQRARMKADAAARAAAIAQDFDREITRAYVLLQVDGATARTRDAARYAEQRAEFRRTAAWPGLVRDTFVFERTGPGAGTLLRFDERTRRLEAADWPAELGPVRQALHADTAPRRLGAVVPEVPALVAPVAEVFAGIAGGPARTADVPHAIRTLVTRQADAAALRRCTILLLDSELLLGRVLPDLLARQGAGPGARPADYEASVVAASQVLLGPAVRGEGDARADLLRLRFDDIDSAILRSFVPDVLRAAEHNARMTIRVVEGSPAGPARPAAAAWRLVLRHRQGSVDQAVSATLARNLGVSGLILAVLGGGVVLLAASARRARALARRQMEFVAAVSHELRTPLAAIRSAGENLADGVVRDPQQVERYGAIVRDEGLRLSEMVEQTLGFAGADAPARAAHPVDLGALVEQASAPPPGAPAFTIERDVWPGLPRVLGDAAALERAVANLVGNARKHAAAGGSARVAVRPGPGAPPRTVVVEVSDRGPGIDRAEQPRLFEPFFRGRLAR